MIRPFAPTALLLGNLVTGMSVLAPAGMLLDLSSGLGVSVRDAGLLITYGAIVLCIGSPLTAWLTSHIDRRTLLVATLATLAVTNAASAFATSYAVLLAIRIVMLAIGVIYTPQAAGTVALIAPAEKRGNTIAYVFLGWSLAAAVGLPTVTLLAHHFGWQAAYGAIAAIAAIAALLLALRLPRGLFGTPVDLATWTMLARNRLIVLLLIITSTQICGQFVMYSYLGPILSRTANASAQQIAFVFACYGAAGLAGGIIATRLVDRWGGLRTSILSTCMLLIGILICAIGTADVAMTAMGATVWGLGFASTNSMQQVRLVGAEPALGGASVSLNTSTLYLGQAVGSALGGAMYVNDLSGAIGYVAASIAALAVALVVFSGRLAAR